MKKMIFISLVMLVAFSPESKCQYIIAGVVSPGNYYFDYNPDTSMFARPMPHGGLNNPPDTVDIVIGSNNQFVLRFYDWGDGGLGGGGGSATVFPLVGEAGFRACLDSSMTFGGVYQYLYVPDTLNLGDTVKAGQNFRFQTYCYFWSSAYGGLSQPVNFDWLGIGDHYLGFTLLLTQDTLYGWVRINVTSENYGYRTTIKDYALNKNLWIGVRESNAIPGFTLFPNPAKGSVTVKNYLRDKNAILTIQNLLGQTIRTIPFDSDQITIEIGGLEDGVYAMMLTGNHQRQLLKFVIKQ